ncbi:MAG: DUF3137 domain-containing protein [Myxococcota bacterium]
MADPLAPPPAHAALTDFRSFYEGHLRGMLEGLEPLRLALKRRYIILFALMIPIAVVAGIIAKSAGLRTGMAVFVAVVSLFVTLIVGVLVIAPQVKVYVARFKDEVMRRVIAFIDPNLAYDPKGRIEQSTFRESGIFRHGIDRYQGDDLVAGKVGATALRFSEVHAEYRTTSTDSKGRTTTHWHTIFHGLFFQADFNKHFAGRTYVRTDVAERLFGAIGQALQGISFGPTELVKLEDPEFERAFVVHSTDQQEARYILSPSLMSRIVEFRRAAGREIQLSFVSSSVFVAVPFKGELFEPKIWKPLTDPTLLEGYYDALRLVLSIVDALNLDLRIWTKD